MAAMGVQADMAYYGKALGGGLSLGIACGREWLMQRWQKDRPWTTVLIAGTFSASPVLLGSMAAFLEWILSESTKKQYEAQVKLQSESFKSLNDEFEKMKIPLEIYNYDLLFSIGISRPTSYFWLFNYYAMAEGLCVNMSGTSNSMCTMEWKKEHYSELAEKLKRAGKSFEQAGWCIDGFTTLQCQNIVKKEFWGNFKNTVLISLGLSCCSSFKPLKEPLLA